MTLEDFDPNSEYGDITTTHGCTDWVEAGKFLARDIIPEGNEILVAVNGNIVAWRYPARADLLPAGWEHKIVTL